MDELLVPSAKLSETTYVTGKILIRDRLGANDFHYNNDSGGKPCPSETAEERSDQGVARDVCRENNISLHTTAFPDSRELYRLGRRVDGDEFGRNKLFICPRV